jgi:serine/threonine protein kinase
LCLLIFIHIFQVVVAVKIFRISPTEDPEQPMDAKAIKRRALRESKVWLHLTQLNHPNVLPYLGYCSDLGESVALVSPFCSQGNIMTYISKNPSANKPLLVKEVAKGLQYLHFKDVVHADLHCNNIIVEGGHARLADFGRAKIIGDESCKTKLPAGFAPYMAPELLPPDDKVNVDDLFSKHSDVYAFAMCCFKILTGQSPFASYNASLDFHVVLLIYQGKRPQYTRQVQSLIPRKIWTAMEACWQTAPEKRLSVDQVVEAIGR